ncbi:MAG: GNAT family N-acetyltransferase [Oscillospiraceae bacterium]|nr:GNAT family N-acetyltransferase [Oscillospiraceae bacterium]
MVEQIFNVDEKKQISRNILEALIEWFEIEEGRERYIAESSDQIFITAKENGIDIGFLCLKETGKDTVELAVMGVLKNYQRNGIGRKLLEKAKDIAMSKGYSFLQVKTVQMGKYDDYDKTNLFYLNCGFKEFEVFPTLWDTENPCQVYVISLR